MSANVTILRFCILLVVAIPCCSLYTPFSEENAHKNYPGAEIVSLSIPRPLGFAITNELHQQTNRKERVGHLQHNSISLRREWAQVVTLKDVVSPIECSMIASVAAEQSTNWYRTVDNNKISLLSLQEIFPEQMSNDISNVILRTLMPTYAASYRVNSSAFFISDMYIKRQTLSDVSEEYPIWTPQGSNGHNSHSTPSPWVFEISLNDDYEGGGLYFTGTKQVFSTKPGDSMLYNAMNPCTGKLCMYIYICTYTCICISVVLLITM